MTEDKHFDPVLEIPADFREEDELSILENSDDVDKLRELLEDGEIVYRLVKCFHEDSDGVLAATNNRVIFADQRFISSKVVAYTYADIAAVVYNTQIVTISVTLVHHGETIHVTDVDLEHGKRFLNFIHKVIGGNYSAQGNGRVFRHNDDVLKLEDAPSINA